jgi:hypothetical protein
MLKWLLAAVGLYGGFVALVYVAQRDNREHATRLLK